MMFESFLSLPLYLACDFLFLFEITTTQEFL